MGSWKAERHMCTSTHFKSLSLICEELENLERKKVTLQRSYHSVSWLVSWSDNSRRSQLGSLPPFDERFPTFSAATDERMAGSLCFSLCRGCCQTLPQHSPILSVIKLLGDMQLQTSYTSKTLHYSVSQSEPVSAQ